MTKSGGPRCTDQANNAIFSVGAAETAAPPFKTILLPNNTFFLFFFST